jgi:alanine dehydrogenase
LCLARILVECIKPCASAADLEHALRAGGISKDEVYAELADLALRSKVWLHERNELVIFDSSGTGVQDVATAWEYREGRGTGIGGQFELPEAAMEQ